jgi:hypothetical protein
VAEKLAWMRGLAAEAEQVADLIEEYASLGISEFILSGYPTLRRRTGSARECCPSCADAESGQRVSGSWSRRDSRVIQGHRG